MKWVQNSDVSSQRSRSSQSGNQNLVWIDSKLIGSAEVEQWINEERSHELIPIWEQEDKFGQIWSEGGGWSNLITRYLAVPSLWPLPGPGQSGGWGPPHGSDHNWRDPRPCFIIRRPPTSRFMLYWSTPVKKVTKELRGCIMDKNKLSLEDEKTTLFKPWLWWKLCWSGYNDHPSAGDELMTMSNC